LCFFKEYREKFPAGALKEIFDGATGVGTIIRLSSPWRILLGRKRISEGGFNQR